MKVVKGARLGFTLIELLVVIAIIAILAAILFPVFSRARDKAQQSWMMWGNTLMLWTLDVTWFENKQFDRTHWHNETNNFLFADGHAKAMKFTNMTWANFFNYGPEDAQYNYPITRRP